MKPEKDVNVNQELLSSSELIKYKNDIKSIYDDGIDEGGGILGVFLALLKLLSGKK